MAKRKHISWKTKCAAALAWWDGVPYDDLKQMTEDQFLSLYHFDHNILHESRHEDRDKFWNLTPRSIKEHREKTKRDLKIIAKGRRIRAKLETVYVDLADVLGHGPSSPGWPEPKRKIRSRGFDKTKRRKMSGQVVER